MKKSIISLVFLLTIGFSNAQSFSLFIDYVYSLPEDQRMEAVDSFMTIITPNGSPFDIFNRPLNN